jgi:transposase
VNARSSFQLPATVAVDRYDGQAKALIGYDVSGQLDVQPAQYYVVVTKCEKRACKHSEEGGVVAGPGTGADHREEHGDRHGGG